jgi:sulfite exporter TauE/SafE/copper chaperone CopZ
MKKPSVKIHSLVLPIQNMHCRSCELLVQKELSKVAGVDTVKVSYKQQQAEISFLKNLPSDESLHNAIRNAGYLPGNAKKLPLFSANVNDYTTVGFSLLILAILFCIVRASGLLSYSFNPTGQISFPMVITVGLVAGFSTCMALVGGMVLGFSAKWNELHPERTSWQKFEPHVMFNIGRLASFLVLGAVLGALGSVFSLSIGMLSLITLLAGILMIVLGVSLLDIFPRFQSGISLPSFIKKPLNLESQTYSHRSALLGGALTFFLPCGFTQAMQVYAISTGSPMMAAMIMFGFALGTTPGLLTIGGISSIVKGKIGRIFFNTAGVAVILFGLFAVSNAVSTGAGSLVATSSQVAVPSGPTSIPTSKFTLKTTVTGNGYEPYNVTVPPNAEVTWIIDSKERFSCANDLVVPSLKKRMQLQPGENTITFISPASGTIPYSCSMGMYRGVIEIQ